MKNLRRVILLFSFVFCSMAFANKKLLGGAKQIIREDSAHASDIKIVGWAFQSGPKGKLVKKDLLVPIVVRDGEDFQLTGQFISKKKLVKMRIELKVPSNSENFPCSKCKPGQLTIIDKQNVKVEMAVPSAAGTAGFFWSISGDDPRGTYQIEMYLDDVEVAAQNFEVK